MPQSKLQSHPTKQPESLWWFAATQATFMWAFAALLASVTLYMQQTPGMTSKMAYAVFGVYASLLFTLPLPGGYVAEKVGYKNASIVGLGFSILGSFCLLLGHLVFIFGGLALFLVGNALFVPSIFCLLDAAYEKKDVRRDAAFTLSYLIFNLGATFGIFVGGWIHTEYSYSTEFILNVVMILVTAVLLWYTLPKLKLAPGRNISPSVKNWSRSHLLAALMGGALLTSALVVVLFFHVNWNDWLQYGFAIGAVIGLIFIGKRQTKIKARQATYGFMVLCLLAFIFWSLYNLEPSLLSVFVKTNVNRHLLGMTVPPDVFYGFDELFIAILGVGMSRLWLKLAEKNRDLSLPVKFSLALLFIGSGFLLITWVMHAQGFNHIYAGGWVVLMYVLFAIGELFVGPIGFSMVGRLAPQNYEGFFMGVWQLVIGLGGICAGLLGQLTVIPDHALLADSNFIYSQLFLHVGLTAVGACGVMLILSFWIKRLIQN